MLPWRILKPIKQRVFSGSWCNNQEPGGGFEWTKTRNYLCICIICFCFPYLQRRDNLTIELSMKDREYHFCDNNDVNNYDNNDVSNDVNNDDNNTDDQKPPQQCQWIGHMQTRGSSPSKVLSWKMYSDHFNTRTPQVKKFSNKHSVICSASIFLT